MSKRRLSSRAGCLAIAALLIVGNVNADENSSTPTLIRQSQEMIDRAYALYDRGEFFQATSVAEQALSFTEGKFGPRHLQTAASLNALGKIVRDDGQFRRARQLLERAVAIREDILGSRHADTAAALNNLGGVYLMMDEFSRAELLYQRALAIRQNALGFIHPDTAISLNNLGLLYARSGAFEKAITFYRRTLAVRQKLGLDEDPINAFTLTNLGYAYISLGEFIAAEPLFQLALTIREKTLEPEHPNIALSLNALANLSHQTGYFSRAEQLYQRALDIYEKKLGTDHPFIAQVLTDLGSICLRMGKYEQARAFQARALAMRERVFDSTDLAIAYSLNDLGEIDIVTHNYQSAAPLLERALELKRALGVTEHPTIALGLHNLGLVHMNLGDRERAEHLLRDALRMREKALGAKHPDTIETLAILAALMWNVGNVAQAESFLERAQTAQASNSTLLLSSGSENRKEAYLRLLELNTAEYVAFSTAFQDAKSAALGMNAVLEYKGRALDAMSHSVSNLRSNLRAQDQVLFERLSEVATQLSVLTFQEATKLSPEGYARRVAELTKEQEKLETELAKESGDLSKRLARTSADDLCKTIPADSALLEWFRYKPFDPKAPRVSGRQDQTEIRPRYVAYILKRDSDPVAIDIGDAQVVDSMIQRFRSTLSAARSNDVPTRASELSAMLLRPLWPHLRDVTHLLISPDGLLNLLPFATLVDEKGAYLAKRFDITYLTSGRDLVRFRPGVVRQSESIVMADPAFGPPNLVTATTNIAVNAQRSVDFDRSGLIFRPLLNTAMEANELRSLLNLKREDVLLKDDASEGRLRQLHGPRILHIATHGFFLSDQEFSSELRRKGLPPDAQMPLAENPLLRSGIALSGANARRSGDKDDGILTALEAAQLDLNGTELVVLSACDSGVGEIQNGEGVYGLRRALVLAGTQTQVTSLWKVSDEATRQLMVSFYKHLLEGEGRSSALRHAQQDLFALPEYSHPYYWASFISIGDWTPMPSLKKFH